MPIGILFSFFFVVRPSTASFTPVLGLTFDLGRFFYEHTPSTRVDSKDFRLLVALHENARQSYRSLGQRVSLPAPAVRARLTRLEDRGILQGCWVYVHPCIFSR